MILLFIIDASKKGIDDAEVLGVLHSLYLMTFNPLGRQAIITVFGMENYLQVLFPFIDFTGTMSLFITFSILISLT